MVGSFLTSGWWRGLLAAMLLLAAIAPQPTVATPDWLAAAICHAPADSGSPDQPASEHHAHCALCQIGHAVALLPVVARLPAPRMAFAALPQARLVVWPGPGPHRSYASRAPPRIG